MARISNLEINHFKSIRQLKIKCRRINVFIGKPNVGKSNILEATALLGGLYSQNNSKYLSDIVRYDSLPELFHWKDRKKPVEVITDIGVARLRFHLNQINAYDFIVGNDTRVFGWTGESERMDLSLHQMLTNFRQMSKQLAVSVEYRNMFLNVSPAYKTIDQYGKTDSNEEVATIPVKKYIFSDKHFTDTSQNNFTPFLFPPNGVNLIAILENNIDLIDEIGEIFQQYNLGFYIDFDTKKIDIQRLVKKVSVKLPYNLVADTLQRYIFHLAAIKSNRQSVILFEEPEAHSFPKYICDLTELMVKSDNQYFLTTHSPYVLSTLFDHCPPDELAVFICRYDKGEHQTIVKELSDENKTEIIKSNIDLFFNASAFSQ